MGLTPNVVAGAPILSAWGNEVRDRSVQVFANAAERTAQWVAPPEGAASYLRDVDTMEVYHGTAWRLPWAMPWGFIALSEAIADSGGFTAPAEMINVALPATRPANRRVKLSAHGNYEAFGAASQVGLIIQEAAIAIISATETIGAAGQRSTLEASRVIVPTAGAHTYRFMASGNTLASIKATANDPMWIVAEDIGPGGAPA